MESLYFAFGDADFYIMYDAPDNISAAALSVVANRSGFVTSKIIVLLTADEIGQSHQKNHDYRLSAAGTLTLPGGSIDAANGVWQMSRNVRFWE